MIENGILNLDGIIQLRGGTYSVLKEQNPLLGRREVMCEADTGRIKVGDGKKHWNDLEYTSDLGRKSVPVLTVSLASRPTMSKGLISDIGIITNSDGAISVTSSDSEIVKILEDYKVQGVEIGSAVIKIKIEGTQDYFPIEMEISINVINAVRYGYRIKKAESDPYASVEYLYDAVGKKPAHMDFQNGVFDYGDWGNEWFITDNKPLMLKNDGTVDYYLNPNDYSKKEDGTDSDVANVSYDGNAMAQIPLVWVYRYEDDDYLYEIISNIQYDENYKAYAHTRANGTIADYFYIGMFGATGDASKIRSISGQLYTARYALTGAQEISAAQGNGGKWYTYTWSQRSLITTLCILLGKSLDSQSVFGLGTRNYTCPTGTLIDKGQFWGDITTEGQVKVFHVEELWGTMWKRTAGILKYNGYIYVKMTPEGDGYKYDSVDGYINTGIFKDYGIGNAMMIGSCKCGEYGLIPSYDTAGSTSTYFCDACVIGTNGADVCYLIHGETGNPWNQIDLGLMGIFAVLECYPHTVLLTYSGLTMIGTILSCEMPEA